MAETKLVDGDQNASPTSLTETAYQQIEEMIVTLKIEPGTVVSEAVLANQLGFSRTPVREALQRLAREGLVRVMPRRGLLVTEIEVGKQLRMLEVRREIERLLARLAARQRNDAERRAFEAIARDMAGAGDGQDPDAFTRADRALNGLIIRAARNEFAAEAMTLLQGLSRRFWYKFYQQHAGVAESAALHSALALAIASGDQDAAAAASDSLLDYVQTFTRATLESGV